MDERREEERKGEERRKERRGDWIEAFESPDHMVDVQMHVDVDKDKDKDGCKDDGD